MNILAPEMGTLVFFSSDVVKLLLEYGAFVNQTDKAHYKTGLHVACEAQSVACVQYLLDAGADPNVQAEEGRTPLHIGEHECCHVIIGCKYETFAVMMVHLPSSCVALSQAFMANSFQ